MKFLQSKEPCRQWSTCGLTASILGFALSPFAYIAIGALSGFAPAFSFLALPPLLACAGYLGFRLVTKPARRLSSSRHLVLETGSWLVVFAFLVVVSGFGLPTTLERIGLFACLFLIATFVALPIALLRRTALAARMECLAPVTVSALLALILGVTLALTVSYLVGPQVFI